MIKISVSRRQTNGVWHGDITWWDRLFGTFKDTERFAARCGFGEGSEQRLGEMLVFRDVA